VVYWRVVFRRSLCRDPAERREQADRFRRLRRGLKGLVVVRIGAGRYRVAQWIVGMPAIAFKKSARLHREGLVQDIAFDRLVAASSTLRARIWPTTLPRTVTSSA